MIVDSVEVAGRKRTFTLVGAPGAADLILVFHGSKQTGAKHRAFTGGIYDALAGDGTAVAYLDGYRGNWNDARKESSFPARLADIDDVGFARAVIDHLGASRVFGVGYSNGGQMVMRLLHETPPLLSGAAVIGATMPAPANFLLPGTAPAPVPVLLIHGTKDPIVGYEGGEMSWLLRKFFRVGGPMRSMPETARYFAERGGVAGEPVTTTLPGTSVERAEWPSVVLYTLHGAGHTVPGPANAPRILGPTNHDVNAADLVRSALLG